MFRSVIVRSRAARLLNNIRYFSDEVSEAANIEKSINNVMLLGRVGADPQKRGSTERPVVTFSLATHTNYKHETGNFMQRTDWHKISVFKPHLRDTAYKYLKKGQRALINGRISYNEYKDADGNMSSVTSIIADDIIFFQ